MTKNWIAEREALRLFLDKTVGEGTAKDQSEVCGLFQVAGDYLEAGRAKERAVKDGLSLSSPENSEAIPQSVDSMVGPTELESVTSTVSR